MAKNEFHLVSSLRTRIDNLEEEAILKKDFKIFLILGIFGLVVILISSSTFLSIGKIHRDACELVSHSNMTSDTSRDCPKYIDEVIVWRMGIGVLLVVAGVVCILFAWGFLNS